MTAAKIMDVVARLPNCDGQAADALSAYTQVKLEDDPRLRNITKSECPDVWMRLPRRKCPKSWANIGDPVVLLERNLYGHPLAGLLWERQFEKVLQDGRKHRSGNVYMFIENKDCSYRCTWMISTWLERKQNMSPVWKKLMKLVDLGEPTSFLDHVYLGCTQRECKPNETVLEEHRKCSNHKFLLEQLKSLRSWDEPHSKTAPWSYDMG